MKHLSLLLLLVLFGLRPTTTQAQTTDSLARKLAHIFVHVDKSQVSAAS